MRTGAFGALLLSLTKNRLVLTRHAFIYKDGFMIDLNSLMIGHKSLTLLSANDVDDSGVIAGGAIDAKTGVASPFVAVPY